ncbi:MAG: DUF1697 domain-containing protein [Bacteroidota bacterium]
MEKYVAFLRGINVGGKNLILMSELRKLFESERLSHVETFIQSGNVSFRAAVNEPGVLKVKLEKRLETRFGHPVAVMLRTLSELKEAVSDDPFTPFISKEPVKFYVCFLEKIPHRLPELPLINAKEGLEVIRILDADVYIISREVKGRYGFPNNFIEKEFGLLSTARNWNTVQKIAGTP